MPDNCDPSRAMGRDGRLDGGQDVRCSSATVGSAPPCNSSKQTILGLFIGETAMDLDGGTNARE